MDPYTIVNGKVRENFHILRLNLKNEKTVKDSDYIIKLMYSMSRLRTFFFLDKHISTDLIELISKKVLISTYGYFKSLLGIRKIRWDLVYHYEDFMCWDDDYDEDIWFTKRDEYQKRIENFIFNNSPVFHRQYTHYHIKKGFTIYHYHPKDILTNTYRCYNIMYGNVFDGDTRHVNIYL